MIYVRHAEQGHCLLYQKERFGFFSSLDLVQQYQEGSIFWQIFVFGNFYF